MAELGEMIQNTKPDKPRSIREEVENSYGVKISVVYVDHGKLDQPFPQREITEKELASVWPGSSPALCMDSFGSLTDKDLGAARKSSDTSDFFQWAINYAVEKQVPLIGADLLMYGQSSETLEKLTGTEILFTAINYAFGDSGNAQELMKDPVFVNLASKLQTTRTLASGFEKGSVLLGLILAGSLLMESRDKPRSISRRSFLKLLGGGFAATSLASIGLYRSGTQLENEAAELLWENSVQNIGSTENVIDLLNQDRNIKPEDTASELYIARKKINAVLAVSLKLRNLFIADGLDQPRANLMPWVKDSSMGIANIMGGDHLFVDQEYNIAWLIKHRTERWKLIAAFMNKFKSSTEYQGGSSIHADLIERFRQGGVTSYVPEGYPSKILTQRFDYPFMKQSF